MAKVSLNGVIDMHVHTNPDIRHRAYDDFELTDAAVRVGARAIVIKTHQGMTMDRAYPVSYTHLGLLAFGARAGGTVSV